MFNKLLTFCILMLAASADGGTTKDTLASMKKMDFRDAISLAYTCGEVNGEGAPCDRIKAIVDEYRKQVTDQVPIVK